jgi:hypothetical protein
MATAGYVVLASLFVVAAIVLRLLWRYDAQWVTRGLQLVDLRILGEIAGGKRFGVARDRLLRLTARGYATNDKWGGCRITLKGRYADLVFRSRATRDGGPSNPSPA